jgi:hypothetical protein
VTDGDVKLTSDVRKESLTDRNSLKPSCGTSAYCRILGGRGGIPPIQQSGRFDDQVRSVPKVPRRGAATGATTGGRQRRPNSMRNRARQPVLRVPPAAPARAPNDAPVRRPSPPCPLRRTARRVCSRVASTPAVGRLGLRREPAVRDAPFPHLIAGMLQLCKQRERILPNRPERCWTIIPGRAPVAADDEPSRTPKI